MCELSQWDTMIYLLRHKARPMLSLPDDLQVSSSQLCFRTHVRRQPPFPAAVQGLPNTASRCYLLQYRNAKKPERVLPTCGNLQSFWPFAATSIMTTCLPNPSGSSRLPGTGFCTCCGHSAYLGKGCAACSTLQLSVGPHSQVSST